MLCGKHRRKTPRPSRSRDPAGPGRRNSWRPACTSAGAARPARRRKSPADSCWPPRTSAGSSGRGRAGRRAGPAAPRSWLADWRSSLPPVWPQCWQSLGLGPANTNCQQAQLVTQGSPCQFRWREHHKSDHRTSSLVDLLRSLATGWGI